MSIKPNIQKELDSIEIARRIETALIATIEQAKALEGKILKAIECCPNCDNFDVPLERCKLFPDTRPPAKVIAFGCPKFEPRVPF